MRQSHQIIHLEYDLGLEVMDFQFLEEEYE